MYPFAIADVTDYHKYSSLLNTVIVLQFYVRSLNWVSRAGSFWKLQGKNPFSASRVILIPWPVPLPHITQPWAPIVTSPSLPLPLPRKRAVITLSSPRIIWVNFSHLKILNHICKILLLHKVTHRFQRFECGHLCEGGALFNHRRIQSKNYPTHMKIRNESFSQEKMKSTKINPKMNQMLQVEYKDFTSAIQIIQIKLYTRTINENTDNL